MSITIPNPPDLDGLRDEYEKIGNKIMAASKRYERQVDKALADVTVEDIETLDDVMVVLGAPGNRAYKLVQEWLTSLGSPDMRFDGMLIDTEQKKYIGPAVMITLTHPSEAGAKKRNRDLQIALERYMNVLDPVIGDLDAAGIVVKIMDNDCSASGIPELSVRSDGSCEFTMTRYHRTTTEQTWTTLADAIDWLSQNHWYGWPYAEHDEDGF